MTKHDNDNYLKIPDCYDAMPRSYYGDMSPAEPSAPVTTMMLEDYIVQAVNNAAHNAKGELSEAIETHRNYAQRMLHEVSNRVIDIEDMIKSINERIEKLAKVNTLECPPNTYKKRPKDAKKPLVNAEEEDDLTG